MEDGFCMTNCNVRMSSATIPQSVTRSQLDALSACEGVEDGNPPEFGPQQLSWGDLGVRRTLNHRIPEARLRMLWRRGCVIIVIKMRNQG